MKNRFVKRMAFLLVALSMAVGLAFATVTPLPLVTPKGPYISGQPGATTLNFVFTACDNTNGNSFVVTGRETLLVDNTDSGAQTFTITSVADQYSRTQDVTTYSVGPGLFSAFSFSGGQAGWMQSDGTVHLTCSAATIKFAVLTRPN